MTQFGSLLFLATSLSTGKWLVGLQNKGVRTIEGVEVPYYAVVDGIFPLRPSLIKPYDAEKDGPLARRFLHILEHSPRKINQAHFGVNRY